jgi:hypothetical protein
MGTRADFYIGKGKNAEWLGSIAWDGYPSGIEDDILSCTDKINYERLVNDFLSNREDSTFPKDGWPWPWNDSNTTDYAYAFFDDKVWGNCFGKGWFEVTKEPDDENEYWDRPSQFSEFPDMKSIQKVRLDKGSGLIIVGPNGVMN